jgi:hypothetical protein
MDGRGSIPGKGKNIFLFSTASRPALRQNWNEGCVAAYSTGGIDNSRNSGFLEQWFQPGVRVPPGVRQDILGGT